MHNSALNGPFQMLAAAVEPPALQAPNPDPDAAGGGAGEMQQQWPVEAVDLAGVDVSIVSDAAALVSVFDSMMERTIVVPAPPRSTE